MYVVGSKNQFSFFFKFFIYLLLMPHSSWDLSSLQRSNPGPSSERAKS